MEAARALEAQRREDKRQAREEALRQEREAEARRQIEEREEARRERRKRQRDELPAEPAAGEATATLKARPGCNLLLCPAAPSCRPGAAAYAPNRRSPEI